MVPLIVCVVIFIVCVFANVHLWVSVCAHSGPCCASYLARMFLVRPSSFLRSVTSCRKAEFSFSKKPARIAIWFSLSRLASRERFAARLFFLRLAQYLSSCSKSKVREETWKNGNKTKDFFAQPGSVSEFSSLAWFQKVGFHFCSVTHSSSDNYNSVRKA